MDMLHPLNSSSKKASISYRDSLTGQKTIIDARYVDKIASVYHLGAFALGLTTGSLVLQL